MKTGRLCCSASTVVVDNSGTLRPHSRAQKPQENTDFTKTRDPGVAKVPKPLRLQHEFQGKVIKNPTTKVDSVISRMSADDSRSKQA